MQFDLRILGPCGRKPAGPLDITFVLAWHGLCWPEKLRKVLTPQLMNWTLVKSVILKWEFDAACEFDPCSDLRICEHGPIEFIILLSCLGVHSSVTYSKSTRLNSLVSPHKLWSHSRHATFCAAVLVKSQES